MQMQQYMWVGSIWAQCWSVSSRVPFALYLDDVCLPWNERLGLGPAAPLFRVHIDLYLETCMCLSVLWIKHGLIGVQDWLTTVCLFLLLLSSSMSAHRTSHLTSLVLNSFLTALAPTLPLPGIYEGPGGGGVVKYSTFVHSCMHLPVLHPSGSLPHTFFLPLLINTYPLIYLTGEDKKTIKTTASQGAKEKSPLEKEREEWYFPGLYGTWINTRLLIVALLFLVVCS